MKLRSGVSRFFKEGSKVFFAHKWVVDGVASEIIKPATEEHKLTFVKQYNEFCDSLGGPVSEPTKPTKPKKVEKAKEVTV